AGRSDPAAAEAASNPLAEMQRQIDQGNVQAPEDVAAWIGATPRGTSGRRGRHRGSGMRAAGADSAGTPPSPLPSRTLRRRPYDHEIAAAVDYAAMDSAYQSALDLLVMEVRQLQRYQVDELHDAIVEAAGDMGVLSEIAATPQHRDVIQARSASYLRDILGGAVQQAINDGRGLVMRRANPSRIYASELLDTNTCVNCVGRDGTQYQTMEDAARDYPSGGFKDCLGRERCR